jgi:hypothetical protein
MSDSWSQNPSLLFVVEDVALEVVDVVERVPVETEEILKVELELVGVVTLSTT